MRNGPLAPFFVPLNRKWKSPIFTPAPWEGVDWENAKNVPRRWWKLERCPSLTSQKRISSEMVRVLIGVGLMVAFKSS